MYLLKVYPKCYLTYTKDIKKAWEVMTKYSNTNDNPIETDYIPFDPDEREAQMIALATDLAYKQLKEGTASAQVITHYLKLGASNNRIEKEILEEQKKLIKAKTDNLELNQRLEETYKEAIAAMKTYSGHSDEGDIL